MNNSANHAISGDAVRAAIVGLAVGLLAFLALGPAARLGLQVWSILIGCASFFVLGGGLNGFIRSSVHSLFGALLAVAALAFATHQPEGVGMDFSAWAALGVAITVALLTLAARWSMLSSIPASLLGYISVLVATLPDYRLEKILSPSLENPLFGAIVSLLVGALFAYAAEAVVQRLRVRIDGSLAKS